MSEGAFDNTVRVPAETANKIYDRVREFLGSVGEVDESTLAGLGSTRQVLEGSSNAKPESGDVDLVVQAESSVEEAVDTLISRLDAEGIPTNFFFGNIVSAALPTEGLDSPVQVDVMVAGDSNSHKYLRELKFFSAENYDPDRGFELKGLHRTELVRRIAKAVGLSMARDGLAVYRWNPDHETHESLMQRLEAKLGRTRKESNKEDLRRLISHLGRLNSLSEIRNRLFRDDLLDEPFLSNRLRGASVFGTYASKALEAELCEKRSLQDRDWEDVFQQFLGADKSQLRTFRGVLGFVREQYDNPKGLDRERIEDAFKVYKNALKDKGYWNEGVRQIILDEIPFLADIV